MVTCQNPAIGYADDVGSSDSNEKFKCVVCKEAGVVSGLFSFSPSAKISAGAILYRALHKTLC